MGLCCCKDWRGHLPAPKGTSWARTCTAGWGPQRSGAGRALPALSSYCRGRGGGGEAARPGAARHLPQPGKGLRCACNSPRVTELRRVRLWAPMAPRNPAGAWGRGPGHEGSREEGERPRSRSSKSKAGAEEPPAPGPAHRSSAEGARPPPAPPLRLNRLERGIHSALHSPLPPASVTNLDRGAQTQSFTKVAAKRARGAACGMQQACRGLHAGNLAVEPAAARGPACGQWPFRLLTLD